MRLWQLRANHFNILFLNHTLDRGGGYTYKRFILIRNTTLAVLKSAPGVKFEIF